MSVEHADSLSQLEQLIRGAGQKPVVVDFWATWCGPCLSIAPTFEALAREFSGKAKFVKVDVDKAKDAAQHFRVSSMPTFLFFHNGSRIAEVKGADPNALRNTTEQLVKKFNVFASSQGYSLSSSSNSAKPPASSGWFSSFTSSSAPAPVQESNKTQQRKNPWADPNFVPPYLRKSNAQQDTEKPIAKESEVRKSLEKTSISDNVTDVNQELLLELIDMGFPKEKAEKALRETKNVNLDYAVDWLTSNDDDSSTSTLSSASVQNPENVPAKLLKKGTPLGVKNEEAYNDVDDDVINSIKKKAESSKEELKKAAGLGDKSLSEMSTKEEKLEYIEKLKTARKEQKQISSTEDAKQKEKERRERIKEAMEIKKKREQEEAERLARLARREKEAEKERKKKIMEKIAADKANRSAK
jgi:thioredoxin 1